MAPPIIMHVNYCEQGQAIAEICKKAVAWGFDGVEFRRRRARPGETPAGYLDEIARAAEASGLAQVLFGSPGPDLMNADPAVRTRELDEAEAFFRLAATRVRLTVCNTFTGTLVSSDPAVPRSAYDQNGSGCATEEHWAWAAAGFRRLGDVAAELGFKLAFETHMNYLHDTPAAARKLVDQIDRPAVGINLDYGNTVYFKGAPPLASVIEQAADKLYYVHLKNSIPLGEGRRFPVALSEGEINHREYLRRLKAAGYTGPIGIEAPRPGDREWYAKADLAYTKSLVAELGW